jgi:subfamily B ATP-binding cassette protein MsbA
LFIARELYRKPRLLILDEATSALDSKSESKIQQSIDELKGSVTVIIVAHRLSTIQNVDYVYIMENGTIVENGSYSDLKSDTSSRLTQLIELQRA